MEQQKNHINVLEEFDFPWDIPPEYCEMMLWIIPLLIGTLLNKLPTSYIYS